MEHPTYLIHYGIEGQKWGVRRFQNEDGTYTQEGLERRYTKAEYKSLKKQYKQDVKEATKEYHRLRKESGRDKLLQNRQDTEAAIKKVDDYAFKRASELYQQYKDVKMYKANLKGKEFKESRVGMQEYFNNCGIAEGYLTNSYAYISYLARQTKDGAKVTKIIYRQY